MSAEYSLWCESGELDIEKRGRELRWSDGEALVADEPDFGWWLLTPAGHAAIRAGSVWSSDLTATAVAWLDAAAGDVYLVNEHAERPVAAAGLTEDIKAGDRVRVWPGVRSGRSAVTTTTTGESYLCGSIGVYVEPSADTSGRRVPGGFYALTHIERVED